MFRCVELLFWASLYATSIVHSWLVMELLFVHTDLWYNVYHYLDNLEISVDDISFFASQLLRWAETAKSWIQTGNRLVQLFRYYITHAMI